MKHILLILLAISSSLSAQVTMDDYLTKDVTYNPAIPTPEQVLGYVPGEWHVSHDQLIYYMRTLAQSSDRIIIENYAKSYEGRQLMQLIFTSPANHQKLDQIKASRQGVKTGNTGESPLVVQLGYSVHGNEASGSNASLLVAYYLAAAQGAKIDKMLSQTVIVFDPSYNPDGLNRFASWVNTHNSKNVNPDPNTREHNEVWPGGRTNHYWFDLNRDWMFVQHPESQGRIRQFHAWMPHILTDHHEMGTSRTFFFQPGEPSRIFHHTDPKNTEITSSIAKYHAQMLDSIGSLYYTKEGYDDFYIGKGSAYPDVNGGIGILFEQASSRGHAQESPYGMLTFPFAIRNQLVSSLSTLAASQGLADQLKEYQLQQYRDAAKFNSPLAYIFGDEKDPMKTMELVKILKNHDIKVNVLAKKTTAAGKTFQPGACIVKMNQPQARLIKSLFEVRSDFTDSIFYDISSWTLPLAMNLPFAELTGKSLEESMIGKEITDLSTPGKWIGGTSDFAYIFETFGYFSHRSIQRLQDAGVLVQVIHDVHTSASRTFARGSILIPIGVQREKKEVIRKILGDITQLDGVDVYAVNTGLALSGVDLGSPSIDILPALQIAVLVEDGVSSNEAGEAWHVLDQRVNVKVSLLPVSRLNGADLSRYNRIVMPTGSYSSISKSGVDNLKAWLKRGGVIVAWKSAGTWLTTNEFSKAEYVKEDMDGNGLKTYADYSAATGALETAGTIFQAQVDLTHPLAYGLSSNLLPLFRDHNQIMKKGKNDYSNPVVYTSNPLIGGYVHKTNLEKIKNSMAAQVTAVGQGKVIVLTDNPNFRAFWYGTNKLFFNALYFGHTISGGTAR